MLKNKTALITGASSGIGLATAEIFAENGANLILLARRKEKLLELQNRLKNEYNINVDIIACDIRDYDSVNSCLSKLENKLKDIDILINNAGLAKGLDKISNGKVADWDNMIDTNIKGVLYVSRIIMPYMINAGKGYIINISSLAGHEVYPGGNIYCATKHALNAITKAMIIDLNGTGVRVTSIDPATVETEFSIVRFEGDEEKAKNIYKGFEPLTGRDVAEVVLFCVTRPQNVLIHEILLTPSAQATSTIFSKK